MVIKSSITHSPLDEVFRLSPLAACVRVAIAGGLLMSPLHVAYAHGEADMAAALATATGLPAIDPSQDPNTNINHQAIITHQGTTETVDTSSQTGPTTLQWENFNIAAGYQVIFKEHDSSSVVLNRVSGGGASQIMGSITANGQVYLYNQDGFVFGQHSVVDTHSLIASNLAITDDALLTGITQQGSANPPQPSLGNDNSSAATAAHKNSAIIVQKGANIHASGNDGLVVLAGPTVENDGSISTDNFGQVIMVASQDKVYLQAADAKSPFHGMVVEVDTGGKVSNIGDVLAKQGNITLQGFVVNQEGRLTATTSVNENGSIRLLAEENHAYQGSNLVANQTVRSADAGDGLGTQSAVNMGAASLTQILPDTSNSQLLAQNETATKVNEIIADYSGPTAYDAQAQAQSLIQVVADKVDMQGANGTDAGAAIVAPGAQVNIIATTTPANIDPVTGLLTVHTMDSSANAGKVLLEKGASIDVSGIQNIQVAMARNDAAISVQSYDLRDSPLQKNGPLLGTTVFVDLRQANTILDVSGSIGRIARTVEERLANGGTVNIASDGAVSVDSGAKINVSGGSVAYQDGYILSSQLVDQFGRLVNIGQADPNQVYTAVAGVIVESHPKWITDPSQYIRYYTPAYSMGHFEQGYVQGLNAGALNIFAPKLAWSGDLQAGAVSGPYQRSASTAPTGGTFSFNNLSSTDSATFYSAQVIDFAATQTALQLGVNDVFPSVGGNPSPLVFSQDFVNKSGLQNISVQTVGNVIIDSGVTLSPHANLASAGSLAIQGKTIDVEGNIYLPGGKVNLTADAGIFNDGKETVTVSKHSSIDVSGRWVNDYAQVSGAAMPTTPLLINGGSVNISAQGDVFLNAGSVIKANGGAANSVANVLTAGTGGSISLTSNTILSGTARLHLDGQLSAYALSQGGTLTLNSSNILVSGATVPVNDNVLLLTVENGNLKIAENGGFGSINLVGNGNGENSSALTVTGDVHLHLTQQHRILQGGYVNQGNAASMDSFSQLQGLAQAWQQADTVRQAVNLSLTGALGVSMETGSSIVADNNANVSLTSSSKGGVFVDGLINTPDGSIKLLLVGDGNNTQYESNKAIWVGSNAQLLAKGAVAYNVPNSPGIVTGSVLNGGTVALEADRGYVVIQNRLDKQASIDVSGTSARLDLPVVSSNGALVAGFAAKNVGSDAGKISLTADAGMVLDGSLSGFAGSASNKNGQLDVTLTNAHDNVDHSPGGSGAAFPPIEPYVININQNQAVQLDSKLRYGDNLDNYANDQNTTNLFAADSLYGKATVTSQMISQGGFDDVRFNADVVNFEGNVSLTARSNIDITASIIGWSADASASSGNVSLNTAYLDVTSPAWTTSTTASTPYSGNGNFTSQAQWTDLTGATVWGGFANITLKNTHDLRVNGQLNTKQETVNNNVLDVYAGYIGSMTTMANINLQASQIYPSTLSQFSFNVVDAAANPQGVITISGTNTDPSPLSANGSLTFSAATINQDGVLKAPFGSINLLATSDLTLGSGSLTSVSGADVSTVIPFGTTLGGSSWVYPYSEYSIVFNSKPENNPIQSKQVTLAAPNINMAQGSVVDIRGGGDLMAYEFRSGIGGSNDYLAPGSPSYNGGFAVVPVLASTLSPFDPLQSSALSLLSASQQALYQAGSSVYLSGGNGLPAGTYTIMPSSYALLPGAYLITPLSNSQGFVVNSQRTDGVPIVSGYYTNTATGTRDSLNSAFMIENSQQISTHSAYVVQTANNFFTLQALANAAASIPLLPKDSGQLFLEAQDSLLLQGTIKSSAPTGGRGGKVDITAAAIDVVNTLSVQPVANQLQVLASNLNALGLDSLFLGGTSQFNNVTGQTDITVNSDTVTFEKGVNLQTKDLLVAANTLIDVQKGAVLTASAPVNTGDTVLNVTGNGALLRVSADNQVTVTRTPSSTDPNGNLNIAADSTINGLPINGSGSALKSVLLDAPGQASVLGSIDMKGGSLSLNTNGIDLGEVSGLSDNALKLSNAQLALLNVDELLINSSSGINFYGNVGVVGNNGSVSALHFGKLELNAAAISGFNNAGKVVKIQADSISVQNSSNAASTTAGTGSGQLDISTNSYTQGAGNFAINGFAATNINVAHQDGAGNAFVADGKSRLTVAGDFNVTADYLTGVGGANMVIDATGHQATFSSAGKAVSPVTPYYGGQISVLADGINFNTQVTMPSGKLSLESVKNDLVVGANAQIDLAGRADVFANSVQYTPGGSFSAIADVGSVHLQAGSSINLNAGGGSASAGTLILKAPGQAVDMSGKILAHGGSAQIDQASYFGAGNFDTVMAALSAAGISNSIAFRSRDADIVQAAGQQVVANSITLVADKGNINLSGTLDANGGQGGTINLYAGNSVALANGGQLLAKGSTGNGGTVLLSSLGAGTSSHAAVSVQQGSVIDVSGAANHKGGSVTLRALRNGTGVNIDPVLGAVSGYSQYYAEAVKQYSNADIDNIDNIDMLPTGNITTDFINLVQSDTASYMETAQVSLGSGIVLRPGVEVDYNGTLTLGLGTTWDFYGWQNYTDASGNAHSILPGDLVIRASEGLLMQGSLTDGFGLNPQGNLSIMPVDSWSYQLVSGADMNSANTLATVAANAADLAAGSKDLAIGSSDGSQTYIRTGTGNITLASGGNIVLENQNATVYIGGRVSATDPYGTTAQLANSGVFPFVDYPTDGGSLNVYTDNNIVGVSTDQIINNALTNTTWLYFSQPPQNKVAGDVYPTTWGIGFASNGYSANFAENFGSFGGGNVTINAQGSISDLSVIMPTSGKEVGQPKLDANGNPAVDANGNPIFTTNVIEVNGGGNLAVSAGGDISGGVYYLGQGTGTITAGGQITGSSNSTGNNLPLTAGPQLFLGNSNITLMASDGLSLSAVSDPMIGTAKFFSYTGTSGISASSLSGDVVLGTDNSVAAAANGFNDTLTGLASIYPASLQAVAYGGSTLLGNIDLFPSNQSSLVVLARDNITGISSATPGLITMLDIPIANLPTAYVPGMTDPSITYGYFSFPVKNSSTKALYTTNAPILHANDNQPAYLVTQQGDINQVNLYVGKSGIIQAGRDIVNLNATLQNNDASMVSVVSAGRDITNPVALNVIGSLDSSNLNDKIAVNGPGALLVKSGRNIDLGLSDGIISTGNISQTNLPTGGASLSVIAGLNNNKTPDYANFIAYLSDPANSYKKSMPQSLIDLLKAEATKGLPFAPNIQELPDGSIKLTYDSVLSSVTKTIGDFVRTLPGDASVTDAQALVIFGGLSPDTYLSIQPQLNVALDAVLYNELIIAGSASAADKSVGNASGFAAINNLFPGTTWSGNLSLIFSTIQTKQGGDINLTVPGGSINAGLPFVFPGLVKDSTDLGIITQAAGNINAFSSGDFEVNQSRVFTQGGGDVLIWSSSGNIDAGRGAKSALSVPTVTVSYQNDLKQTLIAPAVSGSGIRAVANYGLPSGNAYLFAPGGVVNAGEAGIGANNVTISATAVIGANNIQVGGVGTGVPAASASVAAGLTGVSNVAANVTQVAQASIDSADDGKSKSKQAALGVLSVEVLGSNKCKDEHGCKN